MARKKRELPKIKMTLKLSQKAVEYLMTKHSVGENGVAKWFGSSVAYMRFVVKGEKILQPKHLKYLKEKNPDEYAELWEHLCAEVIGEAIETGTKFVKSKSSKGVRFLRSIGSEAALAIGKILTPDETDE